MNRRNTSSLLLQRSTERKRVTYGFCSENWETYCTKTRCIPWVTWIYNTEQRDDLKVLSSDFISRYSTTALVQCFFSSPTKKLQSKPEYWMLNMQMRYFKLHCRNTSPTVPIYKQPLLLSPTSFHAMNPYSTS